MKSYIHADRIAIFGAFPVDLATGGGGVENGVGGEVGMLMYRRVGC